MNIEELFSKAEEVSRRSYSPYSEFPVGAALLCEDGTVVTGTNVENRSYGLTICAERSALVAAVSAGKNRYSALAVYCSAADYPVSPCGACRQVISEFVSPDFPVYFRGRTGDTQEWRMGDLLPADALHELKKEEL